MRKKILNVSLLFLLLVIGFGAGYMYKWKRENSNKLPVLGKVPDYTLTNQLGKKVSSDTFKGKIRVVTFLFPYCNEYCPLIALNLVSLEHLLKEVHLENQVQIIAFNVDPENTGTHQMSEFMQQYGWNPENTRWQFLTGKPEQIRRIVTKAYYVYYKKVSEASEDSVAQKEKEEGTYVPTPEVRNDLASKVDPDYDIVHNDALAIVDGKGRIRKIVDDADHLSGEQIFNIIQQLMKTGQ